MKKELFAPSEESMRLREFFSNKERDEFISWEDIDQGSDVRMNNRGKQLARGAIKSLGLYYVAYPGKGIQLEGVRSALPIAGGASARAYTAVKKTAIKSQDLLKRYAPSLPQQKREQLGLVAALAGAMLASGKALLSLKEETPEVVSGLPKDIKVPVVKFE